MPVAKKTTKKATTKKATTKKPAAIRSDITKNQLVMLKALSTARMKKSGATKRELTDATKVENLARILGHPDLKGKGTYPSLHELKMVSVKTEERNNREQHVYRITKKGEARAAKK